MHVLWRGSTTQRLRLASGLVLFAFALTHFLNHALGLISLDVMVAFDHLRTAVTRSAAGGALLAAALITHATLALGKFIARRTYRLPLWEWMQLILGLLIPALLLPHIVNTRVSSIVFGIDTSYPYELRRIWTDTMLGQSALLLLVWTHGCIGLHHWLRLVPSYARLAPTLLVAATLLPCAALLGIVTQGRHLAEITADPAAFAKLKAETHWPDAGTARTLAGWRVDAQIGFYTVAALVVLLGVARTAQQRRAMRIPVQYVPEPLVMAAAGPTLLEVSRMHHIPHMSVCGGRGRCSTCRVMVVGDAEGLLPASAAELQTLESVGAQPNVRLACQARLRSPTAIMPLVHAARDSLVHAPGPGDTAPHGVERDLAVLFIDIRGFTALTESKLPFDTVYLLNSFLHVIGQAIQSHGGWINDRAGDGVLAVFGDASGLPQACAAAIRACAEADRQIDALNARLESELPRPMRVAMGLHCGPHVHGLIGIGSSKTMSVVGPAVNVASRLEYVAKEHDVQLALSDEVARHAGLDLSGLRWNRRRSAGRRSRCRWCWWSVRGSCWRGFRVFRSPRSHTVIVDSVANTNDRLACCRRNCSRSAKDQMHPHVRKANWLVIMACLGSAQHAVALDAESFVRQSLTLDSAWRECNASAAATGNEGGRAAGCA